QLRHKSNVRWLTLDGTAWIAGRRPAWARAARQAAGRDDARRAVLTGARLLRAPRPPASGGWGAWSTGGEGCGRQPPGRKGDGFLVAGDRSRARAGAQSGGWGRG